VFFERPAMPIYEFECSACGARTEELMRLSDPDPTECPTCHEQALRRLVSAPSFRLSGSGWYETDFKKDGKRNLAGDSGGADAKPAETKTEAKPEAKPETPAAKPEPKALA
jgi:putative FmdB family regulatory protein